jgi:predicted TIM-barrel fold metal-dependent hydrolase
MSTDKLIIVSGDGHAEAPPEVWEEYLDPEYREHLPSALEDNEKYVQLLGMFASFDDDLLALIDPEGVWADGRLGALGDVDQRLQQMDREGVAAEMVYWGETQASHMFAPMWQAYPQELYAAGSRVYNRWLADTFGEHLDRFYLCGDPGAGVDMDMMLSDLKWTADRGFRSAFIPMMFERHDVPRLYDTYYDPYWAMLQEHGMWAVCHAGYGGKARSLADKIDEALAKAADGIDILDEMNNKSEDFFHRAYEPLQALWQMMLGGVFDRFPDLRFILTEVRADWIPTMLAHLDAVYDRSRNELAAKHKPSEYWHSNCLQSMSFVHKCEVPMRDEIGLENIIFGRDYPHPEGTWPNTLQWLRDAFAGVPERELRMVLGENAITMLSLERAELRGIANRVGFTVDDITGPGPEIDPRVIESWDTRSGYLKPAEVAKPASIDALLAEDPALAVLVR